MLTEAEREANLRRANRREAVTVTFVLLVLCALVYGAIWAYESFACHMRWSGSGMATRWGLFSGCQVQVSGHWVPERSVRQVP